MPLAINFNPFLLSSALKKKMIFFSLKRQDLTIVNKCCQAEKKWKLDDELYKNSAWIYLHATSFFFSSAFLLLFVKAFTFFFKFRSNLFLHFRRALEISIWLVKTIYLISGETGSFGMSEKVENIRCSAVSFQEMFRCHFCFWYLV